MIKDVTKSFKKSVELDENIVLDNYRLKEGLYIKLNTNNPVEICEDNCIIINSKLKEEDSAHVKKPDLYKWFKEVDYYSSILNDDTNKAVDIKNKKILSNNFMTLFIKKDIFPQVGKTPLDKADLLKYMEYYFDKIMLCEDKFIEIYDKSSNAKGKLKKEKKEEFLQSYFRDQIQYLRSDGRKKRLEDCRNFIFNNVDNIVFVVKSFCELQNFNGYIKLFLDYEKEFYKSESQLYMIPRIFNVNDYNLFIDDKILGLPSNNITTNSKKPYLLLKTMQCMVPYRSSVEDVKFTKDFFEWLLMQGKFKEIKLDYNYSFDGTDSHKKDNSYFSIHLNQNSEIDEFDNVPFSTTQIDFRLENILGIVEKRNKEEKNSPKVVISNEYIKDYETLQKKFSECFYNNRLFGYLKKSDPDIKANEFTGQMRALFMLSRDALFDFFSKGCDTAIKPMVKKLTMDLILERLKKTVQGFNFERIARAYNLRVSLLIYFELGGKEMADKIKITMVNLKSKLISNNLVSCESDDEFYFVVGQLAYYILSQSESDKKSFGIFEPILNVKDSSQLKKKLREFFAVYKHAISVSNVKFKNAFSMVMGYETDKKITDSMQEMLLAGLLANNIFYEKKEDKK